MKEILRQTLEEGQITEETAKYLYDYMTLLIKSITKDQVDEYKTPYDDMYELRIKRSFKALKARKIKEKLIDERGILIEAYGKRTPSGRNSCIIISKTIKDQFNKKNAEEYYANNPFINTSFPEIYAITTITPYGKVKELFSEGLYNAYIISFKADSDGMLKSTITIKPMSAIEIAYFVLNN